MTETAKVAAGENREILLVDDDVTSLDIICFLFEGKGYSVRRCASGEDALKIVEASAPALLIIDLMMPGLDGFETIKLLRSSGYLRPIIAFTAVDDDEAHRRVLDVGGDKVLTKPCAPEKLLTVVQQYMKI
ncbi:MAG: response regulator [bacterium]|nr:response regulator [bacterium]